MSQIRETLKLHNALNFGFILALALTSGKGFASAEKLPDAEIDGIQKVKDWSWNVVVGAEKSFGNSKRRRQSSPEFWGDRVVYQIQVDRFNDGDSKNNLLNIEADQKNGDLKAILDFRHGGDLKGVTQRLDYLKDLGVNSLWLTPFLKHNGSYHGYCTSDPTQVDPGFGKNEDFRDLVSEAHRRGILVVMDVVINHLCDNDTTYTKPANHYQCSDELNSKNWSGQSGGSSGQGQLGFSKNFFGPLKSQYFFNRCGANSQSDMEGTGPAAVYGDFVSVMFDFDTRNQDFQHIFTNLFKYWIAYADVDGFRLDAAKHVSEDFVAYFSTEARHYARSIGKQNFYIVGEVAGPSDWIGRRVGKMFSNPLNPSEHGAVPVTLTNRLWDLKPVYMDHPTSKYPGLTGAYDFAHGGTAIEVLHNRATPKRLQDHFGDSYFNDLAAQNDYRLNWNLLEIHDWPRFASHNIHSMAKSILGVGYLAFSEGQPIVQYGMEQGFNGDCHFDSMNVGSATEAIRSQCKSSGHSVYRQDMFISGMERLGSTVPEIDRLAYIGPVKSQNLGLSDPYVNREHDLYKSARRFLNIRNSCKALKYGSTTFRWVEQNSNEGVLAFSRINRVNENTYEALVVVNTSWTERAVAPMSVEDFSNGKTWKNLLNGFQAGVTRGNGTLDFGDLRIAPNSVMVFVPVDNAGAYNEYLGAHLCAQ